MLKIAHTNFNVFDLEKSLAFYKDLLGFQETRRKEVGGGQLVFLSDGVTGHEIELTYLPSRTKPYDLSDNEIHLGVYSDTFEADLLRHRGLGIVCQDTKPGGHFYFIEDPDGYWVEIIKAKETR